MRTKRLCISDLDILFAIRHAEAICLLLPDWHPLQRAVWCSGIWVTTDGEWMLWRGHIVTTTATGRTSPTNHKRLYNTGRTGQLPWLEMDLHHRRHHDCDCGHLWLHLCG